ncbi:MAG: hypothetical protein GDA55_03120 [Cellvibrionales bacterium]|nr:hypothetical protein [Cellvibrionales bacterium]
MAASIQNKVERISLAGGLLGLIFTDPRRALNALVKKHNAKGWRATFILQHSQHNLFMVLVQLVFLVLTVGLFTFGPGYLVMFEKEE